MVRFSGSANLTASFKFTPPPDDPCCRGNEISDKMGYSSACIRYIYEILAPIKGFQGRAIERCQTNSTVTVPCCHGNEIWDTIGCNSACIGVISEILPLIRIYGLSYWMISVLTSFQKTWKNSDNKTVNIYITRKLCYSKDDRAMRAI